MKTQKSNFKKRIKMIAIGFLFILTGCSLSCRAQDTILLRGGNQIFGKILEISSTEIKYKKTEYLEGPTYTVLKNDVGSIKYKNGTNEIFKYIEPWLLPENKGQTQPVAAKKYPELKKVGSRYWYGDKILSERETQDILLDLNDPLITNQIKMAKRQKGWQYIGFAAIPCGIASMYFFSMSQQTGITVSGQENRPNYTNNGRIWALLAATCVTTSITLKYKRNQSNAAALKLYRQNY